VTQPLFAAVRAALAAQLAAQIPGLRVSASRSAQVNVPAAVVLPAPGTVVSYKETMDGSADLYLRVVVLVGEGDSSSGQDLMDPYLSTTGGQSIYAAVQADPTLGGVVSYADVWEASGYGMIPWGGVDYLGCSFTVRVGI
jgi:hypothetical protein